MRLVHPGDPPPDQQWMGTGDAARILRCSPYVVRRLVLDGTLYAVYRRRRWCILSADVRTEEARRREALGWVV